MASKYRPIVYLGWDTPRWIIWTYEFQGFRVWRELWPLEREIDRGMR